MLKERIGVSNPYALAELISRTKIDWSKGNHKELLERAFGMDYGKLFDPNNSPLFADFPPIEITYLPVTSGRCRQRFKELYALVHTNPTQADLDLLNWHLSNINYEKRGFGFDSECGMDEINQGIINDCFLIASMSAIHAIDTDFFERKFSQPSPNQYSITLLDPEINGIPHTISLSASMCWLKKWYDPNDQELTNPPAVGQDCTEEDVLIYSRSSVFQETWCAMTEKAFYMMADRIRF